MSASCKLQGGTQAKTDRTPFCWGFFVRILSYLRQALPGGNACFVIYGDKKSKAKSHGCFLLQIQSRIHIVHIFLVQLFPQELAGLTEPLEMDDFPFPEEPDHVIHIRVIAEPEDVVVGHPCFLLCCNLIRTTF